MINKSVCYFILISLFITGCATYTTRVDNSAGRATIYEDPNSVGKVAGVGIESQDVVSVTDQMMRDILATPDIANRTVPPRVIIDEAYFINESSSVINKRLITERLMISLNRAAAGRIVFVDRASVEMVLQERTLKRKGVVSGGTLGETSKVAGADFRLIGRIMSQDTTDSKSGDLSRFHMITFKLIDLETTIPVWTNMYEFKKSAQDDIIYR
ncbi:MAG: penicillin-binding protein activator LpoB [Desulfamplus sp.]|nr:penicillin-binding protein activator LpoB [Desulfamplus sp.]